MSEEDKEQDGNEVQTAQDYYASFIGKQAKKTSPFDSKGYKPTTKDDVARVTGKRSSKDDE